MDRQPGHQLRRRLWFPVPPRQGIYGLEPGTASLLEGPSPVEMILEADQERLRHQIRAGVDVKILSLAAALMRFGESLCLLSRASRSAEGKGRVALDITKVGGTPVGFRDVSAAGTLISPSRQPFQISPVCAEPPVVFPLLLQPQVHQQGWTGHGSRSISTGLLRRPILSAPRSPPAV